MRRSLSLYEDLTAVEGLDFGFQRNGLVSMFRTEAFADSVVTTSRLLDEFGIRVEVLDRSGVARLAPSMSDEVLGGAYFPEDAHLDPAAFVEQLAARFSASGGSILTLTDVLKLRAGTRGRVLVETAAGERNAQLVVLAAGAWSAGIARDLKLRLPIEPGKGYSLTLPIDGGPAGVPIRMLEANTTYTPTAHSIRLTSKMDLVGFDLTIDRNRVSGMAPAARRYLKLDHDFGTATAWAGLRPLTPDGVPIVGRHPHLTGLILATGHGQLGVALAPVTGWLVAQLATNQPSELDLKPLELQRFEGVRSR
jgi:D-amino-acid dehydrogenase